MTEPGCWSVSGHDQAACVRTAPGGYCAPARCYCGGCPWFLPIHVMPTYTPDGHTAFDRAAVARGQRVSGARRRAARERS